MSQKYKHITVLSGIAILCVVLIHSHAAYMIDGGKFYYDSIMPYQLPIVDAILGYTIFFAVPIFVFISGFKYEINYKVSNLREYINFISKRIKKVVAPFLLIIFIFFIKDLFLSFNNHENINNLVTTFLYNLLGQRLKAYQLWYIPMLIYISFIYPVISNIIPKKVLIFIFIISSILIEFYLPSKYNTVFITFLTYLVQYEVGVLFARHHNKLIESKIRYVFWGLFIVSLFPYLETDVVIYKISIYILKIIGPITYFYIAYILSSQKYNRVFYWLGINSWAIFLFHEPYFLFYTFKLMIKIGVEKSFFSIIPTTIIPIILSVLFYLLIVKFCDCSKYIFSKYNNLEKYDS